MYRVLRRLLFALPPELAHGLALRTMQAWGALPGAARRDAPVRAMGLSFANRIGLAAGLDKDAIAVRGFARLGFGFLEVGTVTPRPQPGNPRPRLFRSAADGALINRMGFNSAGSAAVSRRLARLRRRGLAVPVGVNIGKNRDTPLARAVDDYLLCLRAVHPHADYVVVNVSSPNTPGLRGLQDAPAAAALLGALVRERDALDAASGHRLPLAVKVAPDLDVAGLGELAAVTRDAGLDAVVATNTTLTRPPGLASDFARQAGGLSGVPLNARAVEVVGALRDALGPEITLIGVGGIHDVGTARAMLDAGADLLQVYTGLIFEGPGLVGELARRERAGTLTLDHRPGTG
ncbi:MAG: quinone-dependent dihydroorotate dehydrogenase [Gammaproteobacteria bacterium]|nr:quinone-dependent dihydroorotate dehydrogenase [Gammaproteobacteria bacterium]